MAKSKSNSGNGKSNAPANTSAKQAEILGVPGFEPSLIDGESASDYEAFRDSCLEAVAPKDALEQVWLQDFMDYTWEAQRLRRMKVAILQTARKSAVEKLVLQFSLENVNWKVAKEIAEGWSHSDTRVRSHVEKLLKVNGLPLDAIMAQATIDNIDTLQTIDGLISSYDYRRDAAIRELEKRRDVLARRARDYAQSMVQEADVEVIEAVQ